VCFDGSLLYTVLILASALSSGRLLALADSLQLDTLRRTVLSALSIPVHYTTFRANLRANRLDDYLKQLSGSPLTAIMHSMHGSYPCLCEVPCICGGFERLPCGCGSGRTLCSRCHAPRPLVPPPGLSVDAAGRGHFRQTTLTPWATAARSAASSGFGATSAPFTQPSSVVDAGFSTRHSSAVHFGLNAPFTQPTNNVGFLGPPAAGTFPTGLFPASAPAFGGASVIGNQPAAQNSAGSQASQG
jgi:hypothetical protein